MSVSLLTAVLHFWALRQYGIKPATPGKGSSDSWPDDRSLDISCLDIPALKLVQLGCVPKARHAPL